MAEWKAYFLLDDALTGSLGSLEAACQTLPGAKSSVCLRPSYCLLLPAALQRTCVWRANLHVVHMPWPRPAVLYSVLEHADPDHPVY